MLGPIFAREFFTVPRREKHHLARVAMLLLFWIIGLTAWQASVGFDRDATLGETARFGLLLFQIVTYVELTLLLFFAALSAAGTVSQEKDRRTFILLLITDMRDYEIVLGKMLGSLLPIVLLLLGTIPFLCGLLLLGGVSANQVFQAILVLGATALASGSLGGLIALWRERTFQALALSTLFVVLYLCLTQLIGVIATQTSGSAEWGFRVQACLDPFVALQSVLEPSVGPNAATPPAYWFVLVMLGYFVLLNGIGIRKLRVWNPSGEPIMQREVPTVEETEAVQGNAIHAAPGDVRDVWKNPILWREVRTLAYGRRPLLVKLAYGIVLALILAFTIQTGGSAAERPAFYAAYALVPVCVLSLLLVSAQAVTSITSERDGKALDLLLVTDISPYEFVFGKLLGVLYNTKEYLLPPLLLATYFATQGTLTNTPKDVSIFGAFITNFVPWFCLLGAIVVLLAFAMTLGIHVALRIENSRLAIGNTLGTIFFICIGTLISIYLIIINGGSLGNQMLSFSAFLGLGIGGLWYVLSADRPSSALSLAAVFCPFAMFYSITNILIAKPGSTESADPLIPFLVIASAFGFTISAMLVPLLSEFDVATGRPTLQEE